jgi:hypothetical protein
MDLQNILLDIKAQFNLERKTVIYLGVGTSAGYREPDGTLAQKNYHQYPPFLQHLKNTVPDLHLSIILIDPQQEDPPYMVKDKGLSLKDKGPDNKGPDNKGPDNKNPDNKGPDNKAPDNKGPDNKGPDNKAIYTSHDQTLTLYTLREEVYTEPYTNTSGRDITPLLREFNQFAIENNILFIYHNFTGRDNRLLAEYFDNELKEHLDHIIYGLGMREDFGCYFDLTCEASFYPYYFDERGSIKLFNLYYFIVNKKLNCIQQAIRRYSIHNNNNKNILAKHMDTIITIIKTELINVMLQVLRVVFRLIHGEEIKEFDKGALTFTCMVGGKRSQCLQYLTNKDYAFLYDFLLNEFGEKLEIIVIFKQLDITGREMLELITLDNDPFKWYNNVKLFA